MSRKLLPRKLTLVAATPTLLNSQSQRSQMIVRNDTGAVLGITTDSAEATVGDCYPVPDDAEFVDNSSSNLYGVSAAGGDVWVFETEP